MVWLTSLFGLLGNVATGIFGVKKEQADTVQRALESLGTVTTSDSAYFAASAAAITSVYQNGPLVERLWRPILMWGCLGMIMARWFGYVIPGMSPTEIDHVYSFIYIGLSGYIPLRSLDKYMQGFQIGGLLKQFISKKIL